MTMERITEAQNVLLLTVAKVVCDMAPDEGKELIERAVLDLDDRCNEFIAVANLALKTAGRR